MRSQHKSWRKRFGVPKSALWPLEKQYRNLPVDQQALKMQRLQDKTAERAQIRLVAGGRGI